MAQFKDYYEILGVPREADKQQVQRAYRKLARKHHPDVSKEAGAEARFREITEAYEVLKDPEKREKYDRFGRDWQRAQRQGAGAGPPPGWEHVRVDFGPGTGGFDFGDVGASGFSSFFESLFGAGAGKRGFEGFGRAPGGAGRGATFVRRGADHRAEIDLGLDEAARGGERSITLSDPTTGETTTLKVRIPPGVEPGQKIRLAAKGAPGSGGGTAGDLYLTVEVRPHPNLSLEGNDLHTTLPITPWEAALGGQASVPTLDGSVTIKIPPGSSSGRRIRLRGRGFPSAKSGTGDLFVELEVVVPEEVTGRERELYEELGRVSSFAPRREAEGGGQ